MPNRCTVASPSASGCAASQPPSVCSLPATSDGALGCVPILQTWPGASYGDAGSVSCRVRFCACH